MYEALRAFFVEGRPSHEVAQSFGYTPGSFRVLCHAFRRDPEPTFFAAAHQSTPSPRRSKSRDLVVALRKQNYSVYEISDTLKEQKTSISPSGVRKILQAEGFAPLPRRLDEERPERVRPSIEAVANVHRFSLASRSFTTRCGGLFLLLPDLVRFPVEDLASAAKLPGSKMIPAAHALRACLSLKLWSIERKSHVMALVADQGLALFSGLNVTPKKSFLAEYSSRVDPRRTQALLSKWHQQLDHDKLFPGDSFNLDFHSVPYYGEHPVIEKHYVSMRSRRQPSVLAFLAQDAEGRAFCYSNADLRKGEESEEIFRFISFWERTHGHKPRHLVFYSKLTTHKNLVRLDDLGVEFITLRPRTAKLLDAVATVPAAAWRTIELDVPARKFKTPRVYEQTVIVENRAFRQLLIQDLGHDEPTILLTNERRPTAAKLITRYAQRMLIENALSDAVRFFHMNALSSTVGLKVDFDMALLVIASGLYRLLARRMRGYADAQARQLFRDLLDMPADVTISNDDVHVAFHRRAHLPIIHASGLLDQPLPIPWWNGRPLRMTA